MSRTKFSEETLRLRREAELAMDAMLRSMNKDRFDSGALEAEHYDEYPEFVTLEGTHMTGWIVAAQYQTFDDMESAAIIHGGSQSAVAAKAGLAKYADQYWN